MWCVIALTLLIAADESYAPVKIGRGLWRSPAGFVYRSDKLFTGDELRRQEAAAGFDVGPVPPRTEEEIRMAFGVRHRRQPSFTAAETFRELRCPVQTASAWQVDAGKAVTEAVPLDAKEPTPQSPANPVGHTDSTSVPSLLVASVSANASPEQATQDGKTEPNPLIDVLLGRRSPGIAVIALAVILYVLALDVLAVRPHTLEPPVSPIA